MTTNLDAGLLKQLADLIETLAKSGKPELDQSLVKKIKKICRVSDGYVTHAYNLVIYQLEQDHAEIRLSSLQICDELFRRSHQFRELLVSEFQPFLELTVEIDPDEPLPPPLPIAKKLKRTALDYIQQWQKTYGQGYKKLELGYNFLKECKNIDFHDVDVRSTSERLRDAEHNRHRENVDKERLDRCIQEMNELQPEIDSSLQQMQECFRILMPESLRLFSDVDFDDPQPGCSTSSSATNQTPDTQVATATSEKGAKLSEEEGGSSEDDEEPDNGWMRQHGIVNANYKLSVDVKPEKLSTKVTSDTLPVVEVLNELRVVLTSKYSQLVAKWTQTIVKCSGSSDLLKKTIDMKNLIEDAINRCREYGVNENTDLSALRNKNENQGDDDDDDDDDFEEVESKEGFEPVIPQHLRAEYGLEPIQPPSSAKQTNITNRNWMPPSRKEFLLELEDPTTAASNLKHLQRKLEATDRLSEDTMTMETDSPSTSGSKSHLLAKAPKLRFDTDLYNWGEKLSAPTVVKYDSLHRFWTPRDNETSEVAQQEEIASMRNRVIEFAGNFEPVKWECRAPLPSGKLCPRRDRLKCPFHGSIIPRDNLGVPTLSEDREKLKMEEERKQRENPDWQDPALLREIKAATGVDLTIKKKGKKVAGKPKKKQPFPGLADLKTKQRTGRHRLERKIFNKGAVQRVASTLDNLDHQKFKDKFGDQFNYAVQV